MLIGLFLLGMVAFSSAEENTSPMVAKTIQIVNAAHDYVMKHSDDMETVQHALRFDPRFHDNENGLYVFIHCYNEAKKEAIVRG